MTSGERTRFSTKPVRIASPYDCEGRLVFADDGLVAVLVLLSPLHGEDAGAWFLEATFGLGLRPAPPTFASLDEAQGWIADQWTG